MTKSVCGLGLHPEDFERSGRSGCNTGIRSRLPLIQNADRDSIVDMPAPTIVLGHSDSSASDRELADIGRTRGGGIKLTRGRNDGFFDDGTSRIPSPQPFGTPA